MGISRILEEHNFIRKFRKYAKHLDEIDGDEEATELSDDHLEWQKMRYYIAGYRCGYLRGKRRYSEKDNKKYCKKQFDGK